MPKAQDYIKNIYPDFIREDIRKIDIRSRNLTGCLDLREFKKLEELNCSDNSITQIDLSQCSQLKKLNANENKWLQIIWRREGEEILIQNYHWKKEWNQHQQSQTQLELKKQKRQGLIIPNSVIWNKIHSDFNFELSQEWKNLGFSYEETKDWINAGFRPTDYTLCAWLRDVAKKDAEWLLNNATREKIERNYLLWQQEQLQAQIESKLKIK